MDQFKQDSDCAGKILIIDDIQFNLQILFGILTEAGYKVRSAENGQIGLDEVAQKRPDLILLDIRMPQMDGFEVCRRLKAEEHSRAIPIIFVSAVDEIEDKALGFRLGAVDYITKPYSAAEVLARVRAHLAIRNTQIRLEISNRKLQVAQKELTHLNAELEMRVRRRTQKLESANEALLKSEAKLSAIYNQTYQFIGLLDTEGRLLSANDTALAFGELKESDILGKYFWETPWWTHDAQLQSKLKNTVHRASQGELVRFETDHPDGNGGVVFVDFTVKPIRDKEGKIIFLLPEGRDITERKQAEILQQLAIEVLNILNESFSLEDSVNQILDIIKRKSGLEAVGIRLQDYGDFPYAAVNGFSNDFLLSENSLVARSPDGSVCLGESGNYSLECTCGLVLSGKTDPTSPFFTPAGSFWSNDTLSMLDLFSENDTRLHPRNSCIHEGFQSVALIPIRSNKEIVGLLQLNDRREGRFTLEMIQFFEGIGASFGVALARKKAEKRLEKSEERFRKLFAKSHDANLLLIDGVLVDCNEASLEMFRATRDQLIGKSPADFSPDQQPDGQLSAEAAEEHVHEALETGSARFEWIHRRMDGTEFWAEVVTTAMDIDGKKGLFGVWRDISERKKEQLRNKLLSTVIDQAHETVVITDKTGVIQYANPEFERRTGYSSDEVVGQNVSILRSGRHSDDFYMQLWNTIKTGQVWNDQIISKRKDGNLFEEDSVIIPIKGERGKIVNYAAINRDVTLEQNLERRLQRAQKMESIGTMASGIAHDFNNILGAIIGFGEMIEMFHSQDDNELQENITELLKAAYRAKSLVKQILTFSRQGESEMQPVLLTPIVKEAIEFLRASLPATIDIKQNIADRPKTVLADATQLHQVVMNLCTNAVQAMGEKAGTLEINLKTEYLDAESAGNYPELPPGTYIKLSISDTGEGIPAEIQNRVFEPYFTTKETGEGTGLGLAVSHGIIQKHQGTIILDSRPGIGTTFHVMLPLTAQSPADAPTAQKNLVQEEAGLVLLVDDEPSLAQLGKKTLTKLGYDVVAETDSAKALELFKEDPGRYDLIISDQTMPGITANITQASDGIQEVNENVSQSSSVSGTIAEEIAEVNRSSDQMLSSSTTVQQSSTSLANVAEQLNQAVTRFKFA